VERRIYFNMFMAASRKRGERNRIRKNKALRAETLLQLNDGGEDLGRTTRRITMHHGKTGARGTRPMRSEYGGEKDRVKGRGGLRKKGAVIVPQKGKLPR